MVLLYFPFVCLGALNASWNGITYTSHVDGFQNHSGSDGTVIKHEVLQTEPVLDCTNWQNLQN
jgi:hypothetical protein